MRFRYVAASLLALVVLLADQVSKIWIIDNIPVWGGFEVIPGFFNIVHVLNKGAAFGFLNDNSITWQTTFFVCTALVAIGVIFYLLKDTCTDRWSVGALGCILGGALGNLTDRIRYGFVVDFLDVYYKNWHWPAFNIADIAICVGVALLLFFWVIFPKSHQH